VAGKYLIDITRGLNMKFKAYGIIFFILISTFAFSKSGDENSATFIVTGNVRAEPNLCG
jgi:hypothetical protein